MYLLLRIAPGFALFPYTTLFRSTVDLQVTCFFVRLVLNGVSRNDLDKDSYLRGRILAYPNPMPRVRDRKSTRLNSSHGYISYAVFCLKKKNDQIEQPPHLIASQD